MLNKDPNPGLIPKAMFFLVFVFFLPPFPRVSQQMAKSSTFATSSNAHERFWCLGKNNLSHLIIQSLPLTSQPERKNKRNTPECNQTSLEEKHHYFTVHTKKQSIPMPHNIQGHRTGSSECLSQNVSIGLGEKACKIPYTYNF